VAFDPDFGKTAFARRLFRLRFRQLKISQAKFASRFGLTLGCVKDQEQARHAPHPALRILVEAIALDPALVEKAAELASSRDAEGPQFIEAIKDAMADRFAAGPPQ
jgi:hypothetical protein